MVRAFSFSRPLLTAAVSSLLLGIGGCAAGTDASPKDAPLGRVVQPIIRGVTSGTEHDEVVVLTNFQEGVRRNLCTATMVAPNLVITARHCVSDTEAAGACNQTGAAVANSGVKADRAPQNLVVFVGKDGKVPNTEVEANGAARGAKLVVAGSNAVCNEDIAFLVLDRNLDTPIAPIRLAPPSLAEKVAAVGWGVDETGELPQAREIRSDIELVAVGPGLYPENPTFGYGDKEFMVGESACAGDSGGPAFTRSGAVVGIASRAGNGQARDPYNYATTCIGTAAHAVYTRLDAHKDLVTRAFAEAGAPMWLEGEPDPRTVRPASGSTGSPTSAADEPTVKKAPLPSQDADVGVEESASAGGCSLVVSGDARRDDVEHAIGVVALLALVAGLRRRLSRPSDGENDAAPHHRPRLPSLP